MKELWEEYYVEQKLVTKNTDHVSCLVPLNLSIYDLKKSNSHIKFFVYPNKIPYFCSQLTVNYCLQMERNPVESTLNKQLRSAQIKKTRPNKSRKDTEQKLVKK